MSEAYKALLGRDLARMTDEELQAHKIECIVGVETLTNAMKVLGDGVIATADGGGYTPGDAMADLRALAQALQTLPQLTMGLTLEAWNASSEQGRRYFEREAAAMNKTKGANHGRRH